METTLKKLKYENVKVILNAAMRPGSPIFLCHEKDFINIVGQEEFENLKFEEKSFLYGNMKRDKMAHIEKLKGEVEELDKKIDKKDDKNV